MAHLKDVLVHLPIATVVARFAAASFDEHRTRHPRSAAVKFNRSFFDAECACHNFVGCIQRHLHLTSIRIHYESLMLGERSRTQRGNHDEYLEGLHSISLGVLIGVVWFVAWMDSGGGCMRRNRGMLSDTGQLGGHAHHARPNS